MGPGELEYELQALSIQHCLPSDSSLGIQDMGENCDTTRLQSFKSLHWLVKALSLSIQDM